MDAFFDTERAVARLVKEWRAHNGLLVAVDFDDTLFDYHSKGDSHKQVIDLLLECSDMGCSISIFTASDVERWDFIIDYCNGLGLNIASVNKNAVDGLKFGHNGKMYFNILLDDRAGLKSAYEILYKTKNTIKNES